ncbi:MAG: STAS domain-containing protein [Desulfamplus sp.]|nr:STAS domain-containing protein [Desulfamplus sp.]
MSKRSILSMINIQSINGCLIVPVTSEVHDDYITLLQKAILEKVKATHSKEVLIDVSAVKFLDSFTFAMLKESAQMVSMLGAYVVFVGFQPGVASALIDLDVKFDDIFTAVTMEDGFELLEYQKSINIDDADTIFDNTLTKEVDEQDPPNIKSSLTD